LTNAAGPALGRYSLGVGDRFAHEAQAQLQAFALAARQGVDVVPVWNKSNREHDAVGSQPADVRAAAERAVGALGWNAPYYVDADHITLDTVERFLAPCDFFTLDVAGAIGRPPAAGAVEAFVERHADLLGTLDVPGIAAPLTITREEAARTAAQYLTAVSEAARLFSRIAAARADAPFVTEVSMDETDTPQTPAELLLILAAIADAAIPAQTIAPRFSGRFNKGVEYVGDVATFEREFADDVAVVAHAVRAFGLPDGLKLSVHSGSDKFAIFPAIRRTLRATGAGVHVKTSGTTWLEEVIGLAEAGGDGLAFVKDLYADACARRDELCAPYASVIDIDPARLPSPAAFRAWPAAHVVAAVRHDPADPAYDPDVRQLLHVSYKLAAASGARYLNLLESCREPIARNVTANIYERHLAPLFLA
jgi:tagaturonate epimerase